MRCAAALLFIFFGLSPAQQPDHPSVHDGRFWRSSPADARMGFVLGYHDGLASGYATYAKNTKELTTYLNAYWPDLANGEIEESINRFYEIPENRPLEVSVAITVLSMKLKGTSQARIDGFLNRLREQK